jgi:hypothetical protein
MPATESLPTPAVELQSLPPPPPFKDKGEAADAAADLPQAQPPLFAGLKVKDVDRQFREYVYMTVTAIKVGLAIRYSSNPVAAERACEIRPQAVYRKAVEMVRTLMWSPRV